VSRGLYEITLRTTAPAEAMTVLASAKAEVTSTGSGVPKASNLSSERVVVTLTSHALPSVRALTAPVLTTSAPAVAGATLAGRLILPGDGGSLSASRSGMLKVAAVRSNVT